ncbi:MAG: hypothetical protein J7K54_02270 [Candidatus Aenigmarchaeota archaeon]|nr:hypothetical protein [Candidatus Aenigmarchaeota archaeon]
MIPVTREFLLYALGALVVVLIVLIAMIFRKRNALMNVKGGAVAEAKPEETGPSDAHAIKSKIADEGVQSAHGAQQQTGGLKQEEAEADKAKSEPAAQQQTEAESVLEKKTEPAGPEPKAVEEVRHQPEKRKEEAQPEPVFEEGVVEQGVELHDPEEDFHDKAYAPKPEGAESAHGAQQQTGGLKQEEAEAAPKPQKKKAPEPEFVVLGDEEEDTEVSPEQEAQPDSAESAPAAQQKTEAKPDSAESALDKKPAAQPEKAKQKPAVVKILEPKKEEKEVPHDKAPTLKTAEINDDAKTFMDQTVSVEGTLSLSSKGTDFWYVLFDDSGSAIVRSEKEIPLKSCRITAVVKKTRLGQIYLDALRYEKI